MHLFCALRVTSAETLCVSASASQPECVSSQSFQNGVCVCVCAFCCAPCLLWWREAHLAFLVERGFPFGGERCTLPFLVERGAPCLFGEERRTLPFWWREVFLLVERGAPRLFWWREVHLAFLVKRGAPCLSGGERFFFWRREVHLAFLVERDSTMVRAFCAPCLQLVLGP